MIRRDGEKPKLRLKGAETRHLVPFGVELAKEMHEAKPSEHSKLVLSLMRHLMTFYYCMGATDFNADLASTTSHQVCLAYAALAKHASKSWAWNMKPKMHLFVELGQYQSHQHGNPKNFWTYQDESWMGVISDIAASAGGPRQVTTIPLQVFRGIKILSS